MAHFVGLDVSVKETAVCVVDDAGQVVSEQKVATEPDDMRERDALLRTINTYFGDRIDLKDQPYAVSSAQLFRDKLKEFSCWDDPW